MTVTVRLHRFHPCRVEFDDVALRLLLQAPGDDHLDLVFAMAPQRGERVLCVEPTAPLGESLLVFGGPGDVLTMHCQAVPHALAAVLEAVGEVTGRRARCWFPWPRRGMAGALAVLLLYRGDTSGRVRALLRRANADARRRPVVHLSDPGTVNGA
ncbi:hypothetical protein ACWKSP_17930 [Micromonosporaceae bacterium Da 78-11]